MTHVYVIEAEGGPVKIGIAGNPARRLAALKTASFAPLSLRFAGRLPDGEAARVEAVAHSILASARANGEWFAVSVADAVAAVMDAAESLSLRLEPAALPEDRGPAPNLTPAQIRAARAMLDITQSELAAAAGISKTGINNIERGTADPKASTLISIQVALEKSGIEFTSDGGPGVRLTA